MIIADLSETEGRCYPALRTTKNLVGGMSPIRTKNFCMGYVTLKPGGGQVPWHNQEQEEIYFILDGTGEMCLGEERQIMTSGQAVYIPQKVYHQLTNIIVVEGFNLYQNYPNPFNPETSIKFSLDQPQHVRLSIYSLGGQLTRILENEYKQAGIHTACWDGRDENGYVVSSGIYIYRIESDYGYHVMKKAVFLK